MLGSMPSPEMFFPILSTTSTSHSSKSSLLPQAKANPSIEILTDLYDLPFDSEGNLF